MIAIFSNVIGVLKPKHKNKFLFLQGLVIITSLFDVVTVFLFGAFMTILNKTDIRNTSTIINWFYNFFKFNNNNDFILLFSIVLLLIILCSSILSIYTIRSLSHYAAEIGSEFGDRLYSFYMNETFIYHRNINSSELIKKISIEVNRVTDNILQPFVQINARIATVLLIIVFLIWYNPFVAFTGLAIIAFSYILMFFYVKNRLETNGQTISINSKDRFKLMNEGFAAIKEIQILGRELFFVDKFKKSGHAFTKAYGSSNTLYNAPRYIIEFILYFSIISMILFIILKNDENLVSVLTTFSVFGIAIFKLLPSFQQIFSGYAQIRGNLSALESILPDLKTALFNPITPITKFENKINGEIILDKIFFKYFNKNNFSIDNLSLIVKKNSKIGIVGPSGSGKSTIMDILMGVIIPEIGNIYVGNQKIINSNLKDWQNNIGYVSQNPIMLDTTIAENIAFGINSNEIDLDKLKEAIRIAQLEEWIDNLPLKHNSIVGERGLQISGGQRQRIAIARAMYHDVEYLFFDEATSALDTNTEKEVIAAIDGMTGSKTIIMIAHRINTVKNCDTIYLIINGTIKTYGTYNFLMENSKEFVKLSGE